MNADFVVFISHRTLMTALTILAPILGSALLVGTSIQEVTLTFIPKIAVVGLVILFTIPWMLDTVTRFSLLIFDQITLLGR